MALNDKIPRIINICYRNKDIPDFVLQRLSDLNPGYSVRLFDDSECLSFLGDSFGGEYADCFNHIQHGPIKADFWRACIIYHEGGAYFDIDVDHERGIDEYLEDEATFMTSTSIDAGRVNPIVLIARKGNPSLGFVVKEYIRMFKSGAPYGYWQWSVCNLLYSAIESALGRGFDNTIQGLFPAGQDVYQFANEDARSFTKYKGLRIFRNHHDLYRPVSGPSMRGFVQGGKSPAFEDDTVRVEVAEHPHPDTFVLSYSSGRVTVRRTDQETGWGQNLMLKIHLKSKPKASVLAVGSSSENSKTVEVPLWRDHGTGREYPKILVLLAGEAFRHGQHGRERDTEDSLKTQSAASLSHVRLMDHVKSKYGLESDVVISSYATKYEDRLLGWYGDRLVSSSFKRSLVGLEALIREAIGEVELDSYKAMFVSRVDIQYKDYFLEVFDPAWDRITFPSACWFFQAYLSEAPGWVPRISDTMAFVPKRFFSRVKKSFHLSHNAWDAFRRDGFRDADMGLMLDTYHDSDSAKDYNPLFRMASRRDSPKWYSPNLKMAPDRSRVRCFDYIGFPDWKQPVTEPYEDENYLIAYKYDCYLRKERFSISMDGETRTVSLRRLDSEGGWDSNVVLMVRDKKSGKERELFVGRSETNEVGVSVDYEPNRYEDDEVSVSVRDNDFPDVFHLSRDGEDGLAVTRLDAQSGWGQNLSLVVESKSTGRKRGVRVGSSDKNRKSVKFDSDMLRSDYKPRVALCIRGAVSKIGGPSTIRGSLYEIGRGYVNYRAVAKSVEEHIVKPNSHMQIDTFIHSWNRDLAADLEYLYRPVASLFEDNEMYAEEIGVRCREPKDFSGVSHALSCKRVIQLKEQYERDNGLSYDIVVLYRPDVLLWKDMPLDMYDLAQGVFVNAHSDGNGDFHFVMSSEDASLFKGLYDSPLQGNPQVLHGWIKNYVQRYMNTSIIIDEIVPGRDQEVIRPHKMREGPINVYKVSLGVLSKYGVISSDIH